MPSTVRIPGYGETPLPDGITVQWSPANQAWVVSAQHPAAGHHRRGRAHDYAKVRGYSGGVALGRWPFKPGGRHVGRVFPPSELGGGRLVPSPQRRAATL